jgi:hypothetical protein
MIEETISMKVIVVTDQAAGTAGMKLAERPEPQAAINDVVVQVHASGFVGTELAWPSTWTDRLDRASCYLAGTSTRLVRRPLSALFAGTVGKDTVSQVWRKVKSDWGAWTT